MPANICFERRHFLPVAGAAISMCFPNGARAQVAGTKSLGVRLPIAPRLQWDDLGGYCGECCVQQAALYYGTYVSQFACRAIINPNQKTQLLVGLNEQTVLSALRLGSVAFDHVRTPTPQFPAYFVWLKRQLNLSRPVLITAYEKGLGDPDYDHIMLATGFSGVDTVNFNPLDNLGFNDCLHPAVFNRTASTLSDNRRMSGNGSKFDFCVPRNICYGCAVSGIQDASRLALPVRISLENWSEPDIIADEVPVMLKGSVVIKGLAVGKSYSLYRYNDYRFVPTANYARSQYSSVLNFTATAASESFPVSIPSNGVAVFRCLPAGQ